ncbi:DUF3169 family protein [Ferdinandcohnia sp. Marseille-Q9671]
MKLILQFIVGGLVGFVVAYALMNFSEFTFSGEITVISLLVISIILIALSLFRIQQIKSLNKQTFSGDEEDEVEDRKYKLAADYSLFTNSSFVFSILLLSLCLITDQNLLFKLAAIGLIIIAYFMIQYMTHFMKQSNPERNIPSASDPEYAQNFLNYADDGEKHVILDGLYRSYNLLNISLIIAITLSTVYSVTGDHSQTFSIILMAVVLLVVNSKYFLVVRNK